MRDKLPIEIKWEHVYGHQDKRCLSRPLTQREQLNCKADAGAKAFLGHVRSNKLQPEMILYRTQWRLRYGNSYIYRNLQERIYDCRHGKKLRKHIMKRKGYSTDVFRIIDWDSIECAGWSISCGEQTWLMKHVAQYNNPVVRQIHRREYWLDSKFPRCNSKNEDSTHVIMCPHATAKNAWLTPSCN